MGSFMSKHSLANNRFIKDMPIEHDMHRDGPKNMNKGYGQEVPGGPPMHDEFTRKNNIKHDGPKNYDTEKGSHAHPHDGPKIKIKSATISNNTKENKDGTKTTVHTYEQGGKGFHVDPKSGEERGLGSTHADRFSTQGRIMQQTYKTKKGVRANDERGFRVGGPTVVGADSFDRKAGRIVHGTVGDGLKRDYEKMSQLGPSTVSYTHLTLPTNREV